MRVELSRDIDLGALAARYPLTGAQIRDAIVDAAYAAAASEEDVSQRLLVEAVRRQYDKAGRTVPA